MSNKLHKLDCPFTQCCLITGVIYETARHMALSFLIIIIMREGKGKSTRREEGENVFYYTQKLLPRVINSRHFFQLLLCCWHDEWLGHQHAVRLQERGHRLRGKEGNARAYTRGGAGSGVQGPLAGSHQAVHFPGGLMLFAVTQTAPSPACHQHHAWNPSYRRLRGRAGHTATQHLASPLPALLLPKPSCYN